VSAGADASPGEELVAGLYPVDPAHLTRVGDGAGAWRAGRAGEAGGYIAIEVPAGMAPRAGALRALMGAPVPGLLCPLAHGAATPTGRKPGWFVICPAPPGPSLAAEPAEWTARTLIGEVLRPAAATLARLAERGLTHRAVRPDNLFRAGPGEPVVLGPAWAGPPASRQPALYEPPYVGICPASGRGEGSIADDVYALGVTLLVLALGREPLAEIDAAEIVRRKLAFGSLTAILDDERLPAGIGDLVRAMLTEDPAHRPAPALLAESGAGRIGSSAVRPPRRAGEPILVGTEEVLEPRSLARAIGVAPQHGVRLLRLGAVESWLRRSFGDAALAHRIEEVARLHAREAIEDEGRADAFLVMRAAAILDPLAPLCWRGTWLWPEGMGPLLAEGSAGATLTELVETEAAAAWAGCRPGRVDATLAQRQARQNRMLLRHPGWAGGMARLTHALNPMLPCRSPLVAGRPVIELKALLPALDAAAGRAESGTALPMDAETAAFVLAHTGTSLEGEFASVGGAAEAPALTVLRVLARLAEGLRAGKLPGLGRMLAERLAPALGAWKERRRRAALQERLGALAAEGDLAAMRDALDDPEGRAQDAEGMRRAAVAVQRIDAALALLAAGAPGRAEAARRLGQEIAAGIGLVAVAGTLAVLALG
jgi:eukaryotic-like serine/threonine-protein kinase